MERYLFAIELWITFITNVLLCCFLLDCLVYILTSTEFVSEEYLSAVIQTLISAVDILGDILLIKVSHIDNLFALC